MSAIKLPKKLSSRLDELAERVRSLVFFRAVTRALFVIPVVALVFILADATFGFSSWVRYGLLSVWGLIVLREIANLWHAKTVTIDAESIAHAIEAEYPRMRERLTTAVELSRHADESNGSPELIREVLKDAQTRAEKLDFERVFPKTAVMRGLWSALVVAFVVLLPLAFVPSAREHTRRFFAPGYIPKIEVDYRINVTSGSPAIKRGDSVTLSGFVEATKPGAELPTTAYAVIITDERTDRIPMTGDESNVYRLKRPALDGNFSYRLEAGLAVSETFHVAVVEPITLSKAKITVTPPPYVKSADGMPPVVIDGLGELSCIEYGSIQFDLQFSPTPRSVVLEFTPEGGDKSTKKKQTVVLNEQGAAAVIWPVKQSGVFQLIAEGDRAVKSEFPPQPLKVIKDEAPKFSRVAGLHDKTRNIRPTEQLQIDCTATDDLSVSQLMLEYRLNDGIVHTKPINSPTLNTPQAEGKFNWNLKEVVKNGDKIEIRLLARDNRRVPEAKLEPQTTYYPAKDWSEFHIREDAAPLAEQDITQRKAEVEAKLKEIREELKGESRSTYSLRSKLANKKSLAPAETEKLQSVRKEVSETNEKLKELADELGVNPELRPLADAIRQLEETDIRTAEQSLAQANEVAQQAERNKKLTTADESLETALKKIDQLIDQNERLAKERLDKRKLQNLAKEQQALAEQAKNADPKSAEELKRQQEQLQAKLKELQEQSEAIKKALAAAKEDEANRLAQEAERLKKEINDLNQAMEKTDNASTAGKLDELKKKQEQLTKKSKELAQQTDNASRAAQSAPLKSDDGAKKALDNGDLDEAAKQIEKAAQELDRLSRDLEAAAAKTRNPREAARQLAQLQENLREKLARETQEKTLDQLPKEERDALIKQQEAIEKAISKLKTPEGDAGAEIGKQRANSDAKKASEALKQPSAEQANRRMQEAKQSLEDLADKLPKDDQRLAKAKDEINKLKTEQQKLRQETEQAKKDLAQKPDELKKKLQDTAKKEAELANRLQQMDVPGQEKRQEKASDQMEKAASELTRGKPEEASKAQQAAQQELERIEQALNGKPSPEPKENTLRQTPGEQADTADLLAKKQRETAQQTQQALDETKGKTGPEADQARKKAKDALKQQQKELENQLGQLGGTEAPKDRQQAEQAMADAKGELDRENFEGAIKKQQEAADALDRLSRESRKEEARQQAERNADLPNREQADAAQRLAQEHRQLRDEAMKTADELRKQTTRKDNPAAELAKEQEKLAQEAHELAKKASERQGENSDASKQANQAAKSAEAGAKKLQNGELDDAQKSGQQTKEQMEKIAKDAPGTETSQQAQDIARRQEDINKKLGELSKDTGAAKSQQLAREKQLAEQAKQLGEKLDQLSREGMSPKGEQQKASENAKNASEQMKAAQQADQNNQRTQAKEARDKAAQSLEQAAQRARSGMKKDQSPSGISPQAGEAVQQADEKMNQAGKELGQGKPGPASEQMKQAARSLEQAANQLGQQKPTPGNPSADGQANNAAPNGQTPGGNEGAPGGTPDLRDFPADIAKYQGKSWGELPGEIKTKIIQQMSTRYGEDYARNIKLYFEQLAERK